MSSRSIRIALAMGALALIPAALLAQPSPDAAAPPQGSALAPSISALDVPIYEIAASMGGRTVLDRDFPGLRTHAMYQFFKAMSLNQIAAMSHGKITPNMLAQAQADLSNLPFAPVSQSVHQTEFEDFDSVPRGGQASLRNGHAK